ncbi:hypothetical protein [Butyrivibrio sp.]|jgi:hypothetical protein|uniref:hypothetical protein n=1 Tax=Butyrivibrio sp. TaxID=28121 RepID=UPI0025C5EBC2|nr:hypothetical protein [Butyrivibrio sp.]MBE5836173.1 hypothetical protein [Butyrivibrio sp.]MBQ7429936.1 hypothetical protein [Butyrivibrio sp.]MBQ7431786.1 hypothetical protein [Butyrivibrio sp.]MBQ9303872.1 hypothetical protein [Butyrivibrio sp.]
MSSILQDDQVFDNEVPFCKVYSKESKKILEDRFLSNRISYFVQWQDQNWLQRLLAGKREQLICTIKINLADVDRATELVEGIEGIRLKDYGRRPIGKKIETNITSSDNN